MIYGYDGKWTQYFPQKGELAAQLEAEREDLMNGSLVLDDRAGTEFFVIFRGVKSFDQRALRGSLGEDGAVAAPPEGLEVVRFELQKELSQSGSEIR